MEDLIVTLLTPTAQVALIVGVAEVVKRFGVDTRYIPLVDLALGLLSGIALYGVALDYGIVNGVVIGLALGLSACGLFSGVKNVIGK